MKMTFHHIDRTGGTTLIVALRQAYGVDNVVDLELGGDPTVVVVGNEFPYSFYNPPDRLPITILRDPVDRLVSWLRFRRQGKLGEGSINDESLTVPASEYLQRTDLEVVRKHVRDRFVRQLGGDFRTDLIPIETAFEVALERLERMFWVGHTETLDADMGRLFGLLKRRNPHIPPQNPAVGPDIGFDVGLLEELTVWDRRLIDEWKLR